MSQEDLVELWLLAKLVEVFMEASGYRPPGFVIYDKVIYAMKLFLDLFEGISNPFSDYVFKPAKQGPYLKLPLLHYIVAQLELEGLVVTALELTPFSELTDELEISELETEELTPDDYAIIIDELSRDSELFKKSMTYFIIPVPENIAKYEQLVERRLSENELQVYRRGLRFIKYHINEIYKSRGHVETKFVVEWIHEVSKALRTHSENSIKFVNVLARA